MAACAFFSNTKNNHIDLDMTEAIEEIFRSLIINRDVNTFYTPGKTLFDLSGAATVNKLKEKYNREYYDIQLIKIAGKDDIGKAIPPVYDRYCYYKSNDYKDKCEFSLRLGDFIVLDTLYMSEEKDLLFTFRNLYDSFKHDKVELLDVKTYMNF